MERPKEAVTGSSVSVCFFGINEVTLLYAATQSVKVYPAAAF